MAFDRSLTESTREDGERSNWARSSPGTRRCGRFDRRGTDGGEFGGGRARNLWGTGDSGVDLGLLGAIPSTGRNRVVMRTFVAPRRSSGEGGRNGGVRWRPWR
jgi:hypothetical protein